MNNIMPTQTSQLVQNLTDIYNEKLLIKAAIGTNSDNFLEYHTLIQEAISEGGGGSSSSSDPWYDFIQTYEMIENEESSADYVRTVISDNFEYEEENGEYTISWDDIEEIETGEVDQNDEPIYEQKTIHVVLTGDPHGIYAEGSNIASALEDYEDLYSCIYPILENVTLTESSDPSEDGYDYLLEGDLYAWNLKDNTNEVEEITENGFYPEGGWFGLNVNVEGSSSREGTMYLLHTSTLNPFPNPYKSSDNIATSPYAYIVNYQLYELNYMDPNTTEETQNSYWYYELENNGTLVATSAAFYAGPTETTGMIDNQFSFIDTKNITGAFNNVNAQYMVSTPAEDPNDPPTWEVDNTIDIPFEGTIDSNTAGMYIQMYTLGLHTYCNIYCNKEMKGSWNSNDDEVTGEWVPQE